MTDNRRRLRSFVRTSVLWTLPAVTVGAGIAGCDGTKAPVSSHALPARTTACDLLTVATIKRLTGTQLGAGAPATRQLTGGSTCNWELPGTHVSPAAVQIQLRRGNGRADFEQRHHELDASGLNKATPASVPGANAAYEIADQGVVAVLVGNTFFQVATIGGSFDAHQHLALAAAAVKALTK